MVHHATLFWARITWPVAGGDPTDFWPNGAAGVDIFFVISGFVMAISTLGRDPGPHPARVFLTRRFLRIAPMYWIVTSVFTAEYLLLLYLPQLKTHGEIYITLSPGWVFSSLLLVPRLHLPIAGVGWTLMYECFFYLLFALALALRVAPWRLLTLVLGSLAIAGHLYAHRYGHLPTDPVLYLITNDINLEFLAGVFIGMAALAGRRLNTILAAVLGAASLLLLVLPANGLTHVPGFNHGRVCSWGIPAAVLVISAVCVEDRFGRLWPRFLLLVGDTSYSLYLSHVLSLCVVMRLFEAFGFLRPGALGRTGEWVSVTVCLVVAVAAGILLYKAVEQPLQRLLQGRRRPQVRTAGVSPNIPGLDNPPR